MRIKFEQFLQSKYGKEITERLVKQNQLDVSSIRFKNLQDQELVKKQLVHLTSLLGLNFEVDGYWAFDFPGWIGELDFNKSPVKKIMVIGLEPHIERFDFQITYGLSDMTPVSNEKRFSIDNSKSNFIRCKDDSSLIWTNLFKLLTNEIDRKAVLEEENEQRLEEFLHQFYITDLCHFAPQDKANAVRKVSHWAKNRFKVADHFLKTEIEIIKPELIITQGTEVFNNLVRCLKLKYFQTYLFDIGTQSQRIMIGQYNNSKIMSLPHIGSLTTHRTFWMKNLEIVRETLNLNGLVSNN